MAKKAYVYSGTDWVPLASEVTDLTPYQTIANSQAPFRNLIINGAMQVAQRGTSTASITASGYYTADRWQTLIETMGTWTQSVETDAPTGSGFRNSVKMLCTTADAAPAAGDVLAFRQIIEGQNLQSIKKGTANAEQLTLSFWVKSNVTGTYIAELYDYDNTRQVSAAYTVNASATWEKKTIVFPADTTGALDNDNGNSFRVLWWLGVGTDYTSGTLNTSWASVTNANRAVGQTNLAAATNNYWQITGVQLEVGAVATPFEFKPFGEELKECQRYYYKNAPGTTGGYHALAHVRSTTQVQAAFYSPTTMRAAPTSFEFSNIAVERGGIGSYAISGGTLEPNNAGPNVVKIAFTNSASGASAGQSISVINNNNAAGYIAVSAEL